MTLRELALLLVLATAPLWAQASNEQLADHPRWQALLHINQGTTWRYQGRSYIDDPDFFLHDSGATDPAAELQASIEQLRPAASEVRCEFPARYRFLSQQLDWPDDGGLSHCNDYQQWREAMPGERVALIFPASYLNSPSSMFGHTLLRIDRGNDEDGVWLSRAINFGATVQGQENSLLYVYRGLFGGYPGYFSNVPYMNKIRDYAHLENRDMWEYQLNLTQSEREWLLAHLWELEDIEFDYLFMDENCSFRLLELISLARPDTGLMADFRLAEVPANTVRSLNRAGFVERVEYRPSKANELDALVARLSADERDLALALARDASVAGEQDFQALSPRRRNLVARTAYAQLRLQHREGERSEAASKRGLALLRVVNRTPTVSGVEPERPVSPEKGHRTKMLAASAGRLGSQGFGEFQARFSYHDWLDNPEGYLNGAAIEAFNARIRRVEGDDLSLEQLDVVNIKSLAPRNRFRKPVSWFVNGGLDRRFIGHKRHLTRHIQGGPGLAWERGASIAYGYAMARAENNSAHQTLVSAAAGARAGVLWYGDGFQLGLEVEGLYFHNDDRRYRPSATLNIPMGRNHALRARLERDGGRERAETEFQLSWRYYFD
ncbi:DUF4105 domain-containing protein [Halomonadaceae bacterium KBTZ08]